MIPAPIREALSQVEDPEVGLDIVTLGLVRRVQDEPDGLLVVLTLTSPVCPMGGLIVEDAEDALRQVAGQRPVRVEIELDPPWSPDAISDEGKALLGWS